MVERVRASPVVMRAFDDPQRFFMKRAPLGELHLVGQHVPEPVQRPGFPHRVRSRPGKLHRAFGVRACHGVIAAGEESGKGIGRFQCRNHVPHLPGALQALLQVVQRGVEIAQQREPLPTPDLQAGAVRMIQRDRRVQRPLEMRQGFRVGMHIQRGLSGPRGVLQRFDPLPGVVEVMPQHAQHPGRRISARLLLERIRHQAMQLLTFRKEQAIEHGITRQGMPELDRWPGVVTTFDEDAPVHQLAQA